MKNDREIGGRGCLERRKIKSREEKNKTTGRSTDVVQTLVKNQNLTKETTNLCSNSFFLFYAVSANLVCDFESTDCSSILTQASDDDFDWSRNTVSFFSNL